MFSIYNDQHALHHGKLEIFRGGLVPCFEMPARGDYVLQEFCVRKLGAIIEPQPTDNAVIQRVHRTSRFAAFALTRPPGHHTGANFFGVYCVFNNAAIAARGMLSIK